jgi:hypothetical protein
MFQTTILLSFLVGLLHQVRAACECGYIDENGNRWIDALVLPFNKITDYNRNMDIYLNDYIHNKAFGNYSYHLDPDNVAQDENGDLLLWTRPPNNEIIPSAQLSTRRNEFFYGTFRSTISFPTLPGSCAGFFYYYNDSQEIDMEYLGQKTEMLYVSSKTILLPDFKANTFENVPLNGTTIGGQFIEYRFDWFSDKVDFYMDHKKISTLPASPSMPGKVMIMNWSSGDKDWSGTPSNDIVAKFRNIAMFFNSSNIFVNQHYKDICSIYGNNENSTCKVQDVSLTEIYGYNQNIIRIATSSSAMEKIILETWFPILVIVMVFVLLWA